MYINNCISWLVLYNSSWKSPILAPAPPWPGPRFIFMWLSIIWNNSPGWGIRPDSILDQTGMSFRDISKAPVLLKIFKLFKWRSRDVGQTWWVGSRLHYRGRMSSCRRRSCSPTSRQPSRECLVRRRGRGWRRREPWGWGEIYKH